MQINLLGPTKLRNNGNLIKAITGGTIQVLVVQFVNTAFVYQVL